MPLNNDVGFQRTCARMAGLLYWVVLIMDLIGMQIHSPAGRSLLLAGSLFTVPLAFGLYYAVRPQQPLLAASAFFCRLLEATLGMVSVIAGYASIRRGSRTQVLETPSCALLSGTIQRILLPLPSQLDQRSSSFCL